MVVFDTEDTIDESGGMRIETIPHVHHEPWIGGSRDFIDRHLSECHGASYSFHGTEAAFDPWEAHRMLHQQEGTPMPRQPTGGTPEPPESDGDAAMARGAIQHMENTIHSLQGHLEQARGQLRAALDRADEFKQAAKDKQALLDETTAMLRMELQHKDEAIANLQAVRDQLTSALNQVMHLQAQLDEKPDVVVMSEKKVAKLKGKTK